MNKSQFTKYLVTSGYELAADTSYPVIITDKVSDFNKILKETKYSGSFGWRKKGNGEINKGADCQE